MNPESEPPPFDFLTSNRAPASYVKGNEEWLVRVKQPLVDLRTVPREQWRVFLFRDVTLPPEILLHLETREPGPMTAKEIDDMEDAVSAYHGVEAPFFINMTPDAWEKGRVWRYVPECAPYRSDFDLRIDE